MKGRKILSALLGVIVLLVFAAVNVNADDIPFPGAYSTINAAIAAAKDGDTVLVAAGTYTLSYIIIMKNGVSLKGAGADVCTLEGMSGGEVIVCDSTIDKDTIIEGFTITHIDSIGRGIKCDNGSSPVIRNNIIIGNSAGFGGGGILCKAFSFPEIRNNQIIGNNTDNWKGGGGILCWDSSPTITDNTITGNHADWIGGGISCLDNSSPIIINNVITWNTTTSVLSSNGNGGGISCEKIGTGVNSPKIANNIIADNYSSNMGGGIACVKSTALITNNVITRNKADGFYGGGGILCLNSSTIIINNIITKNIAGNKDNGAPAVGGIYFYGSPIPTIIYNNVWNNTVYNYDLAYTPDDSNISSDPMFRKPDSDDFHLKSSSPCIDAGYSSTGEYWIPSFDFEGDLRIIGVVDMGADEFDPLSNNPPVAVDDGYSVDEDEILSVPTAEIDGVLENDHDPEDDSLTAVLVNDVSSGTLILSSDGSFTYEPEENFHGTDTFTYKANDGQVDSETAATVTITITPVNDRPVAVNDISYSVYEDGTLTVPAPGVLANDEDPDNVDSDVNDILTAELVDDVSFGTLTLNEDGSLVYIPNADIFGADTFTYKAHDGQVYSVNEATVSITITPVNDSPEANAGSYPTIAANDNCQAEVTLDGTGSSDIDGDTLKYTWDGPFGQASGVQPTVTLGKGTHEITLTVNDNNGGTATDTVQITVEDQTPPVISLSDSVYVSVGKGKGRRKGKWEKVNKLTVSATDNCSSDIVLEIDNVEILNKKGRPDKRKGVYYIIDGNDIYVFPKKKMWIIHVTATATDESDNSVTETISKTLLKSKGWSWKSFFKLLLWKFFH